MAIGVTRRMRQAKAVVRLMVDDDGHARVVDAAGRPISAWLPVSDLVVGQARVAKLATPWHRWSQRELQRLRRPFRPANTGPWERKVGTWVVSLNRRWLPRCASHDRPGRWKPPPADWDLAIERMWHQVNNDWRRATILTTWDRWANWTAKNQNRRLEVARHERGRED